MSQTSRGLTPPNGPIGSSGTIGSTMKVIASSTSPERSSGQVMLRDPAVQVLAQRQQPRGATAAAAAIRMSPMQRIGAEREGQPCRRSRVVAEKVLSARFSSR